MRPGTSRRHPVAARRVPEPEQPLRPHWPRGCARRGAAGGGPGQPPHRPGELARGAVNGADDGALARGPGARIRVDVRLGRQRRRQLRVQVAGEPAGAAQPGIAPQGQASRGSGDRPPGTCRTPPRRGARRSPTTCTPEISLGAKLRHWPVCTAKMRGRLTGPDGGRCATSAAPASPPARSHAPARTRPVTASRRPRAPELATRASATGPRTAVTGIRPRMPVTRVATANPSVPRGTGMVLVPGAGAGSGAGLPLADRRIAGGRPPGGRAAGGPSAALPLARYSC